MHNVPPEVIHELIMLAWNEISLEIVQKSYTSRRMSNNVKGTEYVIS